MSEYNYEKKTYKRLIILIPRSDKKVIEKLESVKSVSGYIKRLIEEDVKGK